MNWFKNILSNPFVQAVAETTVGVVVGILAYDYVIKPGAELLGRASTKLADKLHKKETVETQVQE